FRNYGDRYVIVVSPGSELPLDEIRHAFLHFLLDPLALRYRREVAAKKSLLNIAARAPQLPAGYKEDFSTFLTERRVRARESRRRRPRRESLAGEIDRPEAEGYIRPPIFFLKVEELERAEPAMSYSFPELVKGVEVDRETKRLENVAFAAAPPATDA